MKLLFIADIHIKLGQKNVPVDWAKNRYHSLFLQLNKMCSMADMLVIGGDIFDRIPTIEELELYYNMVKGLPIPTIIYSGNHEALKKNTTFLSNLAASTSWVNHRVKVLDDFCIVDGIDFIPYNKLREPWPEDFEYKVLCTHVRGEIPPHVKPEVDLALFEKWPIVLAGDLHSHSNSQRNIIYPGSPVTTSFHRARVSTGAILLDTTSGSYTWEEFDLPQLIRKTIVAGEPMPKTDFDHTIYEVEGDLSELSSIESSELLDKKVVKRSQDMALILEPDMSVEAELEEYLRYILNLNDESIANILTEYNKYAE